VATGETKLMTAGNIAKALSLPDAKVKKAIAALGLKPKARKGPCNYYGEEVLPKIKSAIK
jgi:hypothetical protein